MEGHFREHLNVRELLLSRPPRHILELGALSAENTVQLLSLRSDIPGLRVTTVTDGREDDEKPRDPYLTWIWGISWVEMAKMPDQSFGAVIIDTDHNYYTLAKELEQAHRLLESPGWIMMHDTVTFGHATGKQLSFKANVPYPLAEIEEAAREGKGMTDAIREFLKRHPQYLMERETLRHHGAMALRHR